ncbi:MAG TPA: hypothetical protein VF177_10505 [Anaerolineae bacterium]
MNQSTTIQELTNRLRRIEAEIVAVREELKALPQQQDQLLPVDVTVPYTWVNKTALREQMQHLFLTLSIQGEPVGPELLQKRMHDAELTSNELSQSIIAAREE